MMQIHLDYYELGITPVVIVRDAGTGVAQQAWRADVAQRKMVRDDAIILDIDDAGTTDFRAIDAEEFKALCADYQVSVPDRDFFTSESAHGIEHMSHRFLKVVGQDFQAESIRIANDTPPRRHLHLVA